MTTAQRRQLAFGLWRLKIALKHGRLRPHGYIRLIAHLLSEHKE